MNECIFLEKTWKKDFDDHRVEKTSDHRYFKDIKECIKQFHTSIAVGPPHCMYVHDIIKHGLEKVCAC